MGKEQAMPLWLHILCVLLVLIVAIAGVINSAKSAHKTSIHPVATTLPR